MKKFLYLIQTRIACLNQYHDLPSSDADVTYLTFEEKIDQPNYIYAPNTDWTEGRNCLIEAAKKRRPYQYYIFLDDDLEFTRGDFRLFEQEVLATRADFAIPVYQDDKVIRNYERMIRPLIKRNLLRCSHIVFFDLAFICLSHELFYDDRLLPYKVHYHKFKNSTCNGYVFWLNLFEYHSQRKLYVINRVRFKNTAHLTCYNQDHTYRKLKQWIKQDYPDYQFLLEKKYPGFSIIKNRRLPLLGNPLRYKIFKRNKKEALWLFILKVGTKASIQTISYIYVYTILFYKDIKLALVMRRQQQQSADGGGYNKA